MIYVITDIEFHFLCKCNIYANLKEDAEKREIPSTVQI